MYSYRHGFSGFAARITESQAAEIAGTIIAQNSICQLKYFHSLRDCLL
jgi:hypothetical protein